MDTRRTLQQQRQRHAIRISNRAELETKYGDILGPMADANPSAYLLCAALKKLTPPVLVTDGVAKEWFKHNRGKLKYVSKAGDLEVHCGARIRDSGRRGMEAEVLRTWLRENVSVDASATTCRTWLNKEWSSDGRLRSVYDVEETIGELLRTSAYAACFGDDTSAEKLAEQLGEGQPPVYTTAAILRQWFQKYHPRADPKSIATVAELEAFLGDDLRSKYQGIPRRQLVQALSQRRCPVLVPDKVARGWLEQHGIPILKRPAQSVPAPCKRPAAAVFEGNAPPGKRQRKDVSSEPLPGPSLTPIASAMELERACGMRYRREYTDLGLGMQAEGDAAYSGGLGLCCQSLCMSKLVEAIQIGRWSHPWQCSRIQPLAYRPSNMVLCRWPPGLASPGEVFAGTRRVCTSLGTAEVAGRTRTAAGALGERQRIAP